MKSNSFATAKLESNLVLTRQTLEAFLDKYGWDSTTDLQLIEWADDLKIKNFIVLMKDELTKLSRKNYSLICNYHDSTEKVIHWVAVYRKGKHKYYFDSYGIQRIKEAMDFLEHGTHYTFLIQPEICGQLSLYILYKLNQGKDFYAIVLEMNDFFDT